ncbi:transient receptor potential cation channel protein painless-like [Lucilia sericata]|uniref:transient receptor potential cation channel protein painless-like n=1 Tax=Lucilia sericata TaxID=13632 RepID=UPI0018A870D2|nr:transient receptor potential cation channel protein painless-like [Lucilia sericata]
MNKQNYDIADEIICLLENQLQLHNAFKHRNIDAFKEALMDKANPLLNYTNQNICVLEEAAQTPDCSDFVFYSVIFANINDFEFTTELKNKIIAYVCESGDLKSLNELAFCLNIGPNDLNPLNSLAYKINNENVINMKKCMQVLMHNEDCLNIADNRGMTPLHNVITNNDLNEEHKSEILQMFLSLYASHLVIDIDTFRNGELRSILEMSYPYIKLPPKVSLYEALKNCLKSGDMELFQKFYKDNILDIEEWEKLALMEISLNLEYNRAFYFILLNGVDFKADLNRLKDVISIILNKGMCDIFYVLLEHFDKELIANITHHVIAFFKSQPSSLVRKSYDCLHNFLVCDNFDINAINCEEYTPLQAAIMWQQEELVKVLLSHGACINLETNKQKLPLNGLSASLLQEHFDDCISFNYANDIHSYSIEIDFKNFSTSQHLYEKKLYTVLSPLTAMALSPEHCYLLQHPVITGLLHLKWQKVSHIFYLNFLISLFFIIAIITQIVLKIHSPYPVTIIITEFFSWLGIIYFLIREFIQLIVSPRKYLKSVSNYLEILLIIFSILISTHAYLEHNLTVSCILLLAYELFSLVGSLPIASFSTHMLMLETVCKSFAKCFLFYSIFLLTYTLCFYIKNDEIAQTVKIKEQEFQRFSNPMLAFFKTIVMFIGEIDAGNLKLDSTFNCLLFLSFLFFVTIILFNLLNGLAVSDTQAIRNQAKINGIICRINLLSDLENCFIKPSKYFLPSLEKKPYRYIYKILNNIVIEYTTDAKINFYPYNRNKIFSEVTARAESEFKSFVMQIESGYINSTKRYSFCCNSLNKWLKSFINSEPTMDKQTSDNALAIRAKKSKNDKNIIANDKICSILKKLQFKS